MRCTASAKALAAALRFASKTIISKTPVPLLACIKLTVGDMTLTAAGTDLDHEHTASVPTSDFPEPGAVCVPGKRFSDLIERLTPSAEATIRTEGDTCTVFYGRSHWKFKTLPAEDFPVLTPPGTDAAAFTLGQNETRRLIRRLEHAIGDDDRHYLAGIYLHRQDGRLTAASTDGHQLVCTTVDLNLGKDLGVIVPVRVVATLNELAAQSDVEVLVDQNRISLRSGLRTVTSKLVDGVFPDYTKILPGKIKNNIEVTSADLIAAAERHAAAADEDTCVGLSWSNSTLTTCLSRAEDAASEKIDATSAVGAGRVAIASHYLIDALRAFDAKSVLIENDGANEPIRFTAPGEPTVMVCMPMYWHKPVENDQPAPPTRNRRGK
jgi:DNA polymerase-3 subunit beta